MHHFKNQARQGLRVLLPNGKALSLRVPDDIRRSFETVRADAIANCAVAAIDSDPQLALEVHSLGAV